MGLAPLLDVVSPQLRGARVAVIDVETTGSTKADRVIEVAVVLFDAFYETEPRVALSSFVDPCGQPVHWKAFETHGIRTSQLRGAPRWEQLWPRVLAALEGAASCGYGLYADLRYLRQEAEICGLQAGPIPHYDDTIDPLRVVRRIDVKPWTLFGATDRRGIEPGEHRAESDALATARLLYTLIGEVYRRPKLGAPKHPTVAQWISWERRGKPPHKCRPPPSAMPDGLPLPTPSTPPPAPLPAPNTPALEVTTWLDPIEARRCQSAQRIEALQRRGELRSKIGVKTAGNAVCAHCAYVLNQPPKAVPQPPGQRPEATPSREAPLRRHFEPRFWLSRVSREYLKTCLICGECSEGGRWGAPRHHTTILDIFDRRDPPKAKPEGFTDADLGLVEEDD